MFDIKKGTGVDVSITLKTTSGATCDLRKARFYSVQLQLPNGSTITCNDSSLGSTTNTIYTRLRPDQELTAVGEYGIFANIKMLDNRMYSTAVTKIVEVSETAQREYTGLVISLALVAVEAPDSVTATGSSPKIGENGTWWVYNDILKAYEDTGIDAGYTKIIERIQGNEADIDNLEETKANKKLPADPGNIAALDTGGNLADSGIAPATIARLGGDKTLLPSQLDPLQGLQTGADTSAGHYSGSVPGLPQSIELLFTTGPDVSAAQRVATYTGQSAGSYWIAALDIAGGGMVATYGVGAPSVPVFSNTLYHVVMCGDYVQVNGMVYPLTGAPMPTNITGLWMGSTDTNARPFMGVIHHSRVFNYSLSGAGALALWNGGRPAERFLPVSGLGGRAYARFTPSYDAAGLGRYHSLPVSAGNDYLDGLVPGETYLLRFTNQSAVTVRAVFGATYLKNGVRTFYRDYTGSIAATGKTSELVLTIDGTLGLNDGRITPTVYAVANEPIGTVALRNVEVVKLGCVAEYLPCGLLPTLWRDTSGNGADLTASGTPAYSYQAAANYGPDFPFPDIEDQCSYGIEWDTAVSSPVCRRIGNMALHRELPVQSRMRGCLLRDDGTVARYMNASSWTAETRDGTAGQVMVEIPAHYRRFETDGTKRRVRISEFPLPGYHLVGKRYISAYEAAVQRSTTTLCSVVNMDADYRGGGNNSAWDGSYRTLLGRPATAISRTNFRNYARKRKANSTEWNCMTYDIHKELYWLFVIEYATLNSQATFNAQKDSNGYAQGGLGAGVTTLTGAEWNTLNGYNPVAPCGHTDSLGNGSGEVPYEVPNADGAILKTVMVPRYRGVENPFGHIWQWTDGINIRISPTEANGGDELSKVFICADPAKFSDSGYNGYAHVGNEARADGYVKEVIFGEGGEIMPSVVGGGSSTYFCDYHYTNIPTTEALRGVLFGGDASNGASAGFAFATTRNAPSSTSANVGSRLCYLPQSQNRQDDEQSVL